MISQKTNDLEWTKPLQKGSVKMDKKKQHPLTNQPKIGRKD